jgi:hypothetical protein
LRVLDVGVGRIGHGDRQCVKDGRSNEITLRQTDRGELGFPAEAARQQRDRIRTPHAPFGGDAGRMDEGGMCGRVVPPSLHTFSHPPPNSASEFGTSHRRGVLRSRLRSRNPDGPRDLTHDGLLNHQSRVNGTSALSSMWPIALATPDVRSGTGYRPPALGRRKLRRKASSLCVYVVR